VSTTTNQKPRQLRRVALEQLRNGEPLDADLRHMRRRCGDALASLGEARRTAVAAAAAAAAAAVMFCWRTNNIHSNKTHKKTRKKGCAAPGRLRTLLLDVRRLPAPPVLFGRLVASPHLVTLSLRNISTHGAAVGPTILPGGGALGRCCPSLRTLDLTVRWK
jgi:hypothetical protein